MSIKVREISTHRVQGYRLTPDACANKGTIITFGGSEGSSWLEMATKIAQNNYNVLSLYYFGKEHLSNSLSYIDLSFFEDVLRYIEQDEQLQYPITLLGISRGSELALMLAKQYDAISNLVLYAPSAYAFSGINDSPTWLVKDESQPYITFSRKTKIKRFWNRHLPLVNSFIDELNQVKQANESLIDISAFTGNILLFAGKQDRIWPSENMAKLIKEKSISATKVELFVFEEAGQTFNHYHYNGGTLDGNLFAYHNSQEIMLERLSQWQ